MDITVIAAVGSFVVSERVLKPKATVLFILGCVLIFDLTTKTNDVSSLRVYRGPALLASTLCLAAYSLRTWRRNGVACDELLFLPGSSHGESVDNSGGNTNDEFATTTARGTENSKQHQQRLKASEGDFAAGVSRRLKKQLPEEYNNSENDGEEGDLRSSNGLRPFLDRKMNSESEDSKEYSSNPNRKTAAVDAAIQVEVDTDSKNNLNIDTNDTMGPVAVEMVPLHEHDQLSNSDRSLTRTRQKEQQQDSLSNFNSSNNNNDGHQQPESAQQNNNETSPNPRRGNITRIGTFFFFRNNVTSTHNAVYAPSGPSVVGAALDLSLPTLFNFHLFIEAYNHIEAYGTDVYAKLLPLIFLTVLIFRAVFPPFRRGPFYKVVMCTITAPFSPVLFRDAYLGDVLTSLVRPSQDILFALSYYLTVFWGTVTGRYGLSESGDRLQSSWILHNLILPSAALLPLWWKFLQCLREAHDAGKRWPYLGNAFKYLSASLVILYGMSHSEDRRTWLWVLSFGATLLYQIWWDTVMDWNLFVVGPKRDSDAACCCQSQHYINRAMSSSFSPNNRWLLVLQMKVVQPILDLWHRLPNWRQIQIRPIRLYKSEYFYWKIFVYNCIFRFTWMLCFIPAYHLSSTGSEQVTTFSSDTNSYVGFLLPLAELFRRTLWGFLMLENKTIQMNSNDPAYSRLNSGNSLTDFDLEENSREMDDSSDEGLKPTWLQNCTLPWFGAEYEIQQEAVSPNSCNKRSLLARIRRWLSDEETRRKLFVLELITWTAAFVVLGMVATL